MQPKTNSYQSKTFETVIYKSYYDTENILTGLVSEESLIDN